MILIACEESQTVCKAFRQRGKEAYSCDLQEPSGGHPEWHIQGDCLPLLNGYCTFTTMDGIEHRLDRKWDMIIAHPTCTDLAISGTRHFEKKRANGSQREGIEFFCKFLEADCDKVAIENPINIISGKYIEQWFPDLCQKYNLPRKYTQAIQPYEFGDPARKTTWLWLKGLPNLRPTNIVEPDLITYQCANGKLATFRRDYCQGHKVGQRAKNRAKTYPGIAQAMAEQW